MTLQVSPINFGKKRFLPTQTTEKLQTVLKKMNSETTIKTTEYSFSSNILAGLILKNNNKSLGNIVDSSACLRPISLIPEGQNTIKIGKKINLVSNNQTGQILQSKKPFFQSWKKTFQKIEKFLDELQTNFNTPEKVEKRKINISGLTSKGVEKLKIAQWKSNHANT